MPNLDAKYLAIDKDKDSFNMTVTGVPYLKTEYIGKGCDKMHRTLCIFPVTYEGSNKLLSVSLGMAGQIMACIQTSNYDWHYWFRYLVINKFIKPEMVRKDADIVIKINWESKKADRFTVEALGHDKTEDPRGTGPHLFALDPRDET